MSATSPSRIALMALDPEERKALRDPARRARVLTSLIPVGARESWSALQAALDAAATTPCRSDPASFQSEDPDTQEQASRACSWCPCLAACSEYATAANEEHGIWAGVVRHEHKVRSRRAVA